MPITVNRYFCVLVLAIFAMIGCAEEIKTTEEGQLDSTLSTERAANLQTEIQRIALSYGMTGKQSEDVSALEERDVYFKNYYHKGRLVFTAHDLKGDGMIAFRIYGDNFEDQAIYSEFKKKIRVLFETYDKSDN